jgi:hypothetical protein
MWNACEVTPARLRVEHHEEPGVMRLVTCGPLVFVDEREDGGGVSFTSGFPLLAGEGNLLV